MIEDAALYVIAKDICHKMGIPWTDPRTGQMYTPPSVPQVAPKELFLHIHKDGVNASTACPLEDCLLGRRVKYILATEQKGGR